MTILKITRIAENANRFRKVKIFLDGKELGTISNGETKDFEINEGPHILEAKIDWCSSGKLNFTVSEKKWVAFELSSFAKHNPFGIWAAIYYITFGTNKYLNMKQVS